MSDETEIVEQDANSLHHYAEVPIAFEVFETLDAQAIEALRCGKPFEAVRLARSFVKDYDAYPGNHPTDWPKRLGLEHCVFLAAFRNGIRQGGAAVVAGSAARSLIDEIPEAALLWDLRVAPGSRRGGIGTALLARAEAWALARGARRLCVETQQINVPACRFYARHGFRLVRATPETYPDFPDELQLIWEKGLLPPPLEAKHPGLRYP